METIFFTGATGSIGGEAAKVCLAQGYRVIALARNTAKADTLARNGAEILLGDLSSEEDMTALTASLRAQKPDLAVLSAGTYFLKDTVDARGHDILLQVNALAPLHLARLLAEQGVRRIVYVSSISASWVRYRGQNLARLGHTRRYALTKRALDAGMEQLAREFPDTAFIRVHPGVSATGLFTQKGSAFPRFLVPLMKPMFPSPQHAARGVVSALTSPPGKAVHPRFFIGGKPKPCRLLPSADALPLTKKEA